MSRRFHVGQRVLHVPSDQYATVLEIGLLRGQATRVRWIDGGGEVTFMNHVLLPAGR